MKEWKRQYFQLSHIYLCVICPVAKSEYCTANVCWQKGQPQSYAHKSCLEGRDTNGTRMLTRHQLFAAQGHVTVANHQTLRLLSPFVTLTNKTGSTNRWIFVDTRHELPHEHSTYAIASVSRHCFSKHCVAETWYRVSSKKHTMWPSVKQFSLITMAGHSVWVKTSLTQMSFSTCQWKHKSHEGGETISLVGP